MNSADISFRPPSRAPSHAADDREAPRGAIAVRTFLGDQSTDYYLKTPRKRAPTDRLLVAVHGIGRNPLQHMIHLATVAERIGAILIAPYFPKNEYPRFQRFRAQNGRLRPDIRLNAIIDDACRLTGLRESLKIDLFGFSAGAQFAHRYAMAYPARTARAVCASAGWYTLPDFNLDFPLGLRQHTENAVWRFDPNAFSLVPMLVAVGDRDVRRNASLNVKPEVDHAQGRTRLDRALFWVDAMNDVARRCGNRPNVRFRSLGHSGHSLRHCVTHGGLADCISDFLGSDAAGAA